MNNEHLEISQEELLNLCLGLGPCQKEASSVRSLQGSGKKVCYQL